MMVKPTVNELLKRVDNRYELVIVTSKRARQLANGDIPVTLAAVEIAEGKVYIKK